MSQVEGAMKAIEDHVAVCEPCRQLAIWKYTRLDVCDAWARLWSELVAARATDRLAWTALLKAGMGPGELA